MGRETPTWQRCALIVNRTLRAGRGVPAGLPRELRCRSHSHVREASAGPSACPPGCLSIRWLALTGRLPAVSLSPGLHRLRSLPRTAERGRTPRPGPGSLASLCGRLQAPRLRAASLHQSARRARTPSAPRPRTGLWPPPPASAKWARLWRRSPRREGLGEAGPSPQRSSASRGKPLRGWAGRPPSPAASGPSAAVSDAMGPNVGEDRKGAPRRASQPPPDSLSPKLSLGGPAWSGHFCTPTLPHTPLGVP